MIRNNKNVDLIRHTALIRGGNNITHTEAVFQIHIRVWYYRSLKWQSNDSSTLMMQISMQLLILLSLLDVSSLLIKVMVSPKETSVEKETGWKWSERLYMLFRGMVSVLDNKFMKHRVSSLQNETNLTRFNSFTVLATLYSATVYSTRSVSTEQPIMWNTSEHDSFLCRKWRDNPYFRVRIRKRFIAKYICTPKEFV